MLQVPLEIAFHNLDGSRPAEQEIRARDRYAIPDDSQRVAPPTGFAPPLK